MRTRSRPDRSAARISWSAFAGTPRALALVWEASPLHTILLGVATILQAFLPAATAWIGKLIVDQVVASMSTPELGLRPFLPLIGLAIGIGVLNNLLSGVSSLCQTLLRDLLGQRINARVIEKALSLDLRFFEDPEYYDMLQRAQQDSTHRPLGMLQQLFGLVRSTITLLSFVGLLLRFSPWLVLVLFITGSPALFVQSSLGRANFEMLRLRAPAWRRLLYLALLLTDKMFAKEIKLFRLGPVLLGRYQQLYTQFFRENRRLTLQRTAANLSLQLLSLVGYYGGYAMVIVETVRGNLSLGDLTMYSAILMQAQSTISGLVSSLAEMYEQNLFLSNLFAFLALEPGMPVRPESEQAPLSLEDSIRFDNVSFSYPGTRMPVLRGIDLVIKAGEKIAVVGENGAGKTTLIKLLARLYDPTDGRILLDGKDLRDLECDSLRARIGVIFQDFVRYPFSARENIGFGQVEALDDDERIRSAAAKSGADEVIARLPQEYDTVLGRLFDEKGPDLSLGQWQKIALARAHMRDAPLLILDEPTSSLDARAEYEIFQRFRELSADRTVILISHRFSTVRMADRIVVLNDGHIAEIGSHDELLATGGLYATMFAMQAEGYR